ncbi:Methyl-accepting chemotaxis protein [Nitrincola lacisaponensis]|uniref:Methyl-accepting chemotaxis protein n=1 Tax=Nitrincola lacisaponensis TaxID=267850 RepID=A0A063Y4N9_9GAMM|nr:DUF4391 domain-containing protein [Nitrincola lacisaponensis]KDE40644.1 Methyl-accepting chemotaxis protein [Nitrincola lacisaponensis]
MNGTSFALLNFPKQAHVGSVVHKRKIYEHTNADTALKNLFVQQVEQITWGYKLAPETINVPSTEAISEIQVFQVSQKSSQLDHRVLQAIDKAIPFPILFEVCYHDQIKLVAAYKRCHEADTTRWVVGRYFESEWQPDTAPREPLPLALNLSVLYEQLLTPLVSASTTSAESPPVEGIQDTAARYTLLDQAGIDPDTPNRAAQADLSLEQRIAFAEAIDAKQKEIDRMHTRLKREKHFNKRVAINSALREAKQQLARLQAGQPTTMNH